MPEGSLTPAQYEIMELAWSSEPLGTTVAEIWQAVSARRSVGRTTVLNLVDRLEKRGWLTRLSTDEGANRYVAAVSQELTSSEIAREMVDQFFGGSASNLLLSLIGNRPLKAEELDRLRHLLEASVNDEETST